MIPNIFFNSKWLNWGGGCGIVWFVFLYFVAGYIRWYVDIENISLKGLLLALVIFLFLPLITKIVIANVSLYLTGNIVGSSIFFSINSVIIVPMTILFFIAFMKIKISGRLDRLIEFVASSMFAVYLISDNMLWRENLWEYCTAKVEGGSAMLPLYVVAITMAVMLICVLIDQLRKFTFWIIAKTTVSQRIENFVSKFISKLYSDL